VQRANKWHNNSLGVKRGRRRAERREEREGKGGVQRAKTALTHSSGAAGRRRNACAIPRIREPVHASPAAPHFDCSAKKRRFSGWGGGGAERGMGYINKSLKKCPRAFRALRRCVRVLIDKRNDLKPYACDYQRKPACLPAKCVRACVRAFMRACVY